jgi:hypothetical protein
VFVCASAGSGLAAARHRAQQTQAGRQHAVGGRPGTGAIIVLYRPAVDSVSKRVSMLWMPVVPASNT